VTASSALGQALTGTIVGTVTDQSGAAVAGATVIVVNTGTNLTAYRSFLLLKSNPVFINLCCTVINKLVCFTGLDPRLIQITARYTF
jgi:hypothetical protein